jgi:uncharacterized protein (DUF433 family)
MQLNYRDIITVEPGKRCGKPCVRGLRITVYDVLDYLASGMSTQELLSDFPELTSDDVLACLAFAADRELWLQTGNISKQKAIDLLIHKKTILYDLLKQQELECVELY